MDGDAMRDVQNSEERRKFLRRLGVGLFAITILDIPDSLQHKAFAAGCGNGVSDANCNVSSAVDANCGQTASAGFNTGGANGKDADENCSASSPYDIDSNCQRTQLPNPGGDPDASCSATNPSRDQSCGDCDDDHDPDGDQHCGASLPGGGSDSDELCGHQHVVQGTEDQACSTSVRDSGCGTHSAAYGMLGLVGWTDPDQSCGKTQADQNCSTSPNGDATCNSSASASTTSPDEGCSQTQIDNACSHYDADESCGFQDTDDQACGKYTYGSDSDGYCPTASQDQSNQDNKGPIKPWCKLVTDADYWNPPPS